MDSLKEVDEALTELQYVTIRRANASTDEANIREAEVQKARKRIREIVQGLEAEADDLNKQLKEFSARVLELEDERAQHASAIRAAKIEVLDWVWAIPKNRLWFTIYQQIATLKAQQEDALREK